jgi:ribonuclease HI
MSKKKKFYVVWRGAKPGIYESWDECARQVNAFPGAQYKSFETISEAQTAYKSAPQFSTKPALSSSNVPFQPKQTKISTGGFIKQSIAVDAAWNTATLKMEYRGVEVWSGHEIFHQGPYAHGTNNVGEFLAIVHALALLTKQKNDLPIYSDSRTAISWVKKKKANTKLETNIHNKELFDAVWRAEKWLEKNTWPNKIFKWETEMWGENPADFGRK